MLQDTGDNDAGGRELLGASFELSDKQKLIPWKSMICVGLTWSGMICGGIAFYYADNFAAGYPLVLLGGLSSLAWLYLAVHHAREYRTACTLEAHVRQHPSQVFRMVLSGRAVAWYSRFTICPVLDERQLVQRRKRLWAYFPWLELGLSTPFPLLHLLMLFILGSDIPAWTLPTAALICVSVFSAVFAIRLILLLTPSFFNDRLRLRHQELSARPGAKEVFFIASPDRSQVAASFDGLLRHYCNIGQLPPQPQQNGLGQAPEGQFLARSQLVAHYSDGEIVGWSLKMIYGVAIGRQWLGGQHHIPVEVSKVEELYQWLASEPRASLFRFCGTTFTAPESRPTRATLISALPAVPEWALPVLFQFPVDERPGMVLVVSPSCGQSGSIRVSLTSMAGNELALLQLQSTDTVADLWWEIDSHPDFAGHRVALMLNNGRLLDDTRTHPMKLAEIMQAASAETQV